MAAQHRVAIISGAERGLGRAIAKKLATNGVIVLPTARDIALSEDVVGELRNSGGQAFAYQLDVTDEESVDRFQIAVEANFGRADILINNAGICIDNIDVPSRADLQIVKQTFDTNLFGAWRLCRAFLPLMLRQNYGRIVNISSAMGQLEAMGCSSPAYRVSKTALNALTCMLAAEASGHDIQVNAVEPGWMRTDMGGTEAPRSAEEGAETPVRLALASEGGSSGCFYFDGRLIPW
jgi:NAD(P)-dependent dehydrogenase (short-subunit alcohol dehydrogenase family)